MRTLARAFLTASLSGALGLSALSQPTPERALSLRDAVEAALSGTGAAAVLLARERATESESQADQARSALLPQIEGTVTQRRQTTNLEAFGLQPQGLFRPPKLVGPYSTFDARIGLTQTIFDRSRWQDHEAARSGVESAQFEAEAVAEQTAAHVWGLYVEALRNRERVRAAESDVHLAESLLELARRQKNVGTGIAIEVTRAEVQLANQRQRLITLRHEYQNALLQLLRTAGLDLTTPVRLTDQLRYDPPEPEAVEVVLSHAQSSRHDLKSAELALHAAELRRSAANWESGPKVAGFADYGTSGLYPNDSIPTWAAGISVVLPVFEGGRTGAERAGAESRIRQAQIVVDDLKRQIELEVRLAFQGLRLADQQVAVASQGLALAELEVEQAQRRYESGVTGSIEVTDAQNRLERARENQILAVFNFNLARINLAQATGQVLSRLP